MKAVLGKVLRSELGQSSLYSGAATLVRIGTLLLMSKIVAVELGREGLGLIGQLTNFVAIVLMAAGGCLNVGIVKYVAEYAHNCREKLPELYRTALIAVICLGLLCALSLILFSSFWSSLLLLSPGYADVFVVFGCTIVLYSVNAYLMNVLNGLKQYRQYNLINITSSVCGLVFSYLLITTYGLRGAFYAMVTSQSVVFFITLAAVRVTHTVPKFAVAGGASREQLRLLSAFVLMSAVSALFAPLIQIVIRNFIIQHLGLSFSGIWEAITRISNTHLLFITTTLSIYYLPRLSELSDRREIHKEIWRMLRIIVPLVVLSSSLIFVLRRYVILFLFSGDFSGAAELFGWQLCGDVLKTISWIIGFQMHAQALTRLFIVTEIFGGLSYLGLAIFMVNRFGLTGTSMGYALNYFIYLVALLFIFRKTLFFRKSK